MIAVVHLQKQILYLEFVFCIAQIGLVGFDASSDTIGDHRIIIRPLSLTCLNWEMFKSRSMQKKGFLPEYMVWWARVTGVYNDPCGDLIVNRSTIALTLNFWGKLPSIHVLSDTWLWRLVTIDLGIFLKDCRWNTFPTLLRNNWDLQKTEKIPFGCRNSAPLGRLMREPVEYKSGSCYANSRAQLDWGVVVPQGLVLQHSQFQSLCYPFFWENNHKNHHIFPRVISQPGNVEWNNSPADPGWFGVTPNPPPPENVHPSGTHRWPNSPVKL